MTMRQSIIANISRIAVRPTTSSRSFVSTLPRRASSNEGRKGPLTGAEKKKDANAGRQGPLTGRQPKDSSTKAPKQQSKNAETSESTKGAEAAADPKTVPGQGMEDRGGHAVPSGPGADGKFSEQGDSALKVAGAPDGVDKDAGREQKVDPKFWSDKKDEK